MFIQETILNTDPNTKGGIVSSESHSLINSMAFTTGYLEDFTFSGNWVGENLTCILKGHIMVNGVVIELDDTVSVQNSSPRAYLHLEIDMDNFDCNLVFNDSSNENVGTINEQRGYADIIIATGSASPQLVIKPVMCMDERVFLDRYKQVHKIVYNTTGSNSTTYMIRLYQTVYVWFSSTTLQNSPSEYSLIPNGVNPHPGPPLRYPVMNDVSSGILLVGQGSAYRFYIHRNNVTTTSGSVFCGQFQYEALDGNFKEYSNMLEV